MKGAFISNNKESMKGLRIEYNLFNHKVSIPLKSVKNHLKS